MAVCRVKFKIIRYGTNFPFVFKWHFIPFLIKINLFLCQTLDRSTDFLCAVVSLKNQSGLDHMPAVQS